MLPFKDRHTSAVSKILELKSMPFVWINPVHVDLVANCSGSNMLKPGIKRRRSKIQIEQDREEEKQANEQVKRQAETIK